MTVNLDKTSKNRPNFTARLGMVVAHYGFASLGYFGLMSVLVVALRDGGFTAGQVALCSSVFLISSKVAKIPVAVVLDRFRPHLSLLAGCWLAGSAFAFLPLVESFPATLTILVIAGFGVSINLLASKQVAADASDRVRSRTTAFAAINVAMNVASAVAAPAALFILSAGHRDQVFFAIGACFAVAGTVSAVSLRSPRREMPDRPGWSVYVRVARTPHLWRLLVANAFGWFLYAQLFNAVPLYVTETLGVEAELGFLFTINAVLIIVFQMPLGHVFEKLTRGDADRVMALSFAMFGVAFLVGGTAEKFAAVVALVVLFSIAEAMFVPSVDVSLLGKIDPSYRAAGYSVLSLATAAGEAIGAAAGLAMLAWMQAASLDQAFWLASAAVAFVFALVARLLRPRRLGDTAG